VNNQHKAFQELIQGNHCWGCGTLNPRGLQIKSYWSGEESVCKFQPQAHHMAGPPHVLNGGIIATVINCHGIPGRGQGDRHGRAHLVRHRLPQCVVQEPHADH